MRFRVFVSLPAEAADQLHFLGRSGRLSPPQNKAPFQEPRFIRLCTQLRIAQIIPPDLRARACARYPQFTGNLPSAFHRPPCRRP